MRADHQRIGLAKLCGWFGLTRQAYYMELGKAAVVAVQEELIVQQVLSIRENHPRIGTRKLHLKLEAFFQAHGIKLGRDALFSLLSANGLLVRKKKRRFVTTNSHHWMRKYLNLIRDLVLSEPNQLWVSDITYWRINSEKHFYISLITDAYSHKIVGWQVAETLGAVESVRALRMALSAFGGAESHPKPTHHSDRGSQYCSKEYVKLLEKNDMQISMTEKGDPLENAIAERVNGIIKEEYLDTCEVENIKEAKKLLNSAIRLYNEDRPHMSIGNLTPSQVHHSKETIKIKKRWKNYFQEKTIFVNQ